MEARAKASLYDLGAMASPKLRSGVRLGPYELIALIGAGGMGEVYRARDTRLRREVAIKVLPASFASDSDRLRRFEQEAQAAVALNHPNILVLFDIGAHQGRPYMVTELLEGETLREKLGLGALSERQVLDYSLQVARGLGAAHAKGIVHRDLKPENLFVTKDERIKLLDFGLAKLADPELSEGSSRVQTMTANTQPGAVLGTIGYMSPEQVRGESADPRSDLFAFGAILYEMVSGRRAFRGKAMIETMNSILNDHPPAVPSVSRLTLAVERIARRCLEKQSRNRFQLAEDVVLALEAASEPAATEPDPRTPSPGVADEPAERSVAVLPFKDLAGGPENVHLGLGLADAIITELAEMKSLLVRPTAAILHYQDRSVPPEQAGQKLGVDAVLDGSFQRAGSRLRVTVQLIGTAKGRPLWGTKIDTSLDDVFRMQDDVSRKVAEALSVQLTPTEERHVARPASPAGPAYEQYLQGKLHLYQESLAEVNAAIDCFEQARKADPEFALAWAGLSEAYARLAFTFQPEGDWHLRAEETCDAALALDPGLPEGHYLRARLLWSPERGFDHASALRELVAAVAARPNLDQAHQWLGTVLLHLTLLEDGMEAFERATTINPQDMISFTLSGFCRYLQGRFSEANEISEDSVRRSPSAWARYQLALSQIQLDQLDAAKRNIDQASRQFPESVFFHTIHGLIAALGGDHETAHRQIQLTVQNKKAFGHYHHAQYDVACIYALLDEHEQALDWLDQAARNGFPCHSFFEIDPMLSSLHGEARFVQLMRSLGAECDGYRRLYAELRPPTQG